jgi:glutaminyl-peptide cyclotransferase
MSRAMMPRSEVQLQCTNWAATKSAVMLHMAHTQQTTVILSAAKNPCICFLLALSIAFVPATAARAQAPTGLISGQSILTLTKQFLAVAPKRYNGSPGHAAAEKLIKDHFKPEAAHGNFEVDQFTANTPAGQQTMRNFIVKFPGKRDGAIVLVTHYETNYPLRNINFVGANDGACTTALLIAIGEYLGAHPPQGYAVWLVFDDGEEAVKDWNLAGQVDHTYGTRHLAAKWDADGTLRRVKALLVADMIGDKDLDILEDEQSTGWLRSIFRQAAVNTRHTAKDTIDKISAQSLQTAADLFLETIRLINQQR